MFYYKIKLKVKFMYKFLFNIMQKLLKLFQSIINFGIVINFKFFT